MTWGALRAEVAARLAGAGVESARIEATWIVDRLGRADDGTSPGDDERVPEIVAARAMAMAECRTAGEPLQHVLGEWSFRDLDVLVDRRALVPRPETEITAEIALEEAERAGLRRGRSDPWSSSGRGEPVVDLGTGSGVLALALAHALDDVEVWGVDASPDALAVARANVAGAGSVSRCVRLVEGCWFEPLPDELRGRLRLVVSNPPYVSEPEWEDLAPVITEHEPREALVAGPTGLEAVAAIVDEAPRWLAPGAPLVVELAPHQGEEAVTRARDAGFAEAHVRPDLTGRPRVLVARRA